MSLDNSIVTPHDHDVLSGRGNFVNYHVGNEHFRALVRKHKVAYVACPKPQKGKFSRMIVDEIRSRNPPGRFLKQDPTTKLWYDIGEKKALDKTRQALREGAPEIMKEIGSDDNGEDDEEQVFQNSSADELPVSNRRKVHSMHDAPPEMNPSSINQMHPSQYIPQPVSNPFHDSVDPIGPPTRMAPPQQQAPPPVAVSSNPAPARIMRPGFSGASPGVVPVRSLAGIRQHMQQQAQRNSALLQQQYSQQAGGMNGMNGYSDIPNRGYVQQQVMMDQFEPRPIGPLSNARASYGDMYAVDAESHEHVGPLPGPLPQRFSREKQNMQREASDRSINMDKVFGQSSNHSKQFDNSGVSMMSLSIGDIASKLAGEDGKNASTDVSAEQLAPLFDSSVRLGDKPEKRGGRKPANPCGSSDGQDLAKVMDMSVLSLGGELSEIGDGSIARMTGSSANMSFSNVFDETDRDA